MAKAAKFVRRRTAGSPPIIEKKPTPSLISKGEFANEAHSSDTKIDERKDVVTQEDRETVVQPVDVLDIGYADTIAFFNEPVKIRLEPSTDENAATTFPVWWNGIPAELFERGKWNQVGYLPVGKPITVKRGVLSIILSAKVTAVKTEHKSPYSGDDEYIENKVKSFTRQLNAVSVINDSPRGHAWMNEQISRYF